MKVNFYYNRDISNDHFKSDPNIDLNFISLRCDFNKNLCINHIECIKTKFKDLSKVIICLDTYNDFKVARPPINIKDVKIKLMRGYSNYKFQNYNFIYVDKNTVTGCKTRQFAKLTVLNYINIVLTGCSVDPYINDYVRVHNGVPIDIIIHRFGDLPYYWTFSSKCLTYCVTQKSDNTWPYLQIDGNHVTSFI